MSERRRSLLVLLARPRADRRRRSTRSRTRDTKLGLDLQGGVQLIYEGEPTAQQPTVTQEALDSARWTSCATASTRSACPSPSCCWRASNQIEVNLPGVEDAERAAQQVGSTAQLFFYDWEANILDENVQDRPGRERQREAADHRLLQGGQDGLQVRPAGRRQQQRRRRAALLRVQQDLQAAATTTGSRPTARRRRSRTSRRSSARTPRCVEVPEGILVVRDEKPSADAPDARPLLGDRGQPGAVGHGHQEPEAELRPAGGNEPIVTFDFTDKGREAFQRDHARDRRARASTTRCRATTRSTRSQHFAIVLDNELVSAPYINYQENPDGIDGSTGAQISGSLHDRLGAGPGEDPRDRRAADPARADLALAGLGHARPAGARPGPGRRPRRLRRSSRSS